jgi:hypothetical protein
MDPAKKKAWKMVHAAYAHKGVPIISGHEKMKEYKETQEAITKKMIMDLKKIHRKSKEVDSDSDVVHDFKRFT